MQDLKSVRLQTLSKNKKSKDHVLARLRDLAIKKGPEAKLPTTRELCEVLGTTANTLNDALEELEVQNVIYRKPRSGIFVSQWLHQKNIALVMGANVFASPHRSPFWDMLWGHVIREAQRRNYTQGESFSIHAILRRENGAEYVSPQLAKMFERSQIDGVIAVSLDDVTYNWMRPFNIPIVSLAGSGMWHVMIDEREMVRLGVDALIRQGCRDIRLWVAGDDNPPFEDTPGYAGIEEVRSGFAQAYKDNGLNCDFGAIHSNRSKAACALSREQQGVIAATELLKNSHGKLPDALMITDDMMAIGVIRTLYENGVHPGVDIQIASHENKGVLILSIFSGNITRVEVDTELVVRRMFEILDRELGGMQSEERVELIKPFTVLTPRTDR